MNQDNKETEIKRAERPTSSREGHERNPSIRTLMNSKRYQQATPKHEMMEQVFVSPHDDDIQDLELEANMAPKLERLESFINRLIIEKSHAMRTSNELQSRNALLERTLKHSKQQYTMLEAENKKLKNKLNNNKYLQDQLNDLQSINRDDDVLSIVSLQTQVQNLEDTQRKETMKHKNIKKSLEDVINDPGLPSYLREKLVLLLPNFYKTTTTEYDGCSPSITAHMKLDVLSDNESSPDPSLTPVDIEQICADQTSSPLLTSTTANMFDSVFSIIPRIKPSLTTSASFDTKKKLIHYKKRLVLTKPNKSCSNHQRSVSSNSYKSSNEYLYDDEEKEINFKSILVPSPRPKESRPKPPPPPRNGKKSPTKKHLKQTLSDDLTKINKESPQIKRIRSISLDIGCIASPTSVSSVIANKGSPPTLDTDNNNNINMNQRKRHRFKKKHKMKIAKEKRALYQRSKAKTAFEFGGYRGYSPSDKSDSDFSTDNDNLYDPPFQDKRNKLFPVNLRWNNNKKRKERKKSIKVSKKEEENLNTRRSVLRSKISSKRRTDEALINVPIDMLPGQRSISANPPSSRPQTRYYGSAQIGRNNNKKKKKKALLIMSKTCSTDSKIEININPLSPAANVKNISNDNNISPIKINLSPKRNNNKNNNKKKVKSSSLQLTKKRNKKKKINREDIIKKEPLKPTPLNPMNNPKTTRMDLLRNNNKLNKKRYSSPSVVIPNNIKERERGRKHNGNMSHHGVKLDKLSFSVSPRAPISDCTSDTDKVWTLKDLIREMVSNGYNTDRVRNALILCHITFTTSIDLFVELRRFFRMSITKMTENILYFQDDQDDRYQSDDDRRWFMRQKITQCISYWIEEYWMEDFAKNKLLQKEIEFFKSDIRSSIHDINRSKLLIESLMEKLSDIYNKYGGINPKNLNLPSKIDKIKQQKKEKEEKKDNDDDGTVIDGSINNMASKPQISQSKTGQNLIKSYNDEQEKKELEKLTKELHFVEARYPDLIQLKLDVVISDSFNIMGLDPEDVAIQLTLLDSFVFKKIKKRECIEQNWKKKDKALRAPNILKMIGQFNDVSKWVQMTILQGETPRIRKRYIKKMISMATYFMQNGNLSSLCSFYNGLTSRNISQLHASWKLLSKSKRRELEDIKALFGWKTKKFKEMQEELNPPCIPHIGNILEILFQIDEGKQNKNDNGSVNYIKMMMLYEQINNLQILQSKHYRDEPNFLTQKLLIREFKLHSGLTDDDLCKTAKDVANSEKCQKK